MAPRQYPRRTQQRKVLHKTKWFMLDLQKWRVCRFLILQLSFRGLYGRFDLTTKYYFLNSFHNNDDTYKQRKQSVTSEKKNYVVSSLRRQWCIFSYECLDSSYLIYRRHHSQLSSHGLNWNTNQVWLCNIKVEASGKVENKGASNRRWKLQHLSHLLFYQAFFLFSKRFTSTN